MKNASKTIPKQCPTLAWLARQSDPFQTPDQLLARLRLATSESKFLEWKITPPIGPAVSLKTKYRVVKAIVSFANTEGGFVVFGIGQKGEWIGFARPDLQQTDAAALAELINGCISPEITGLNYAELQHDGRLFPVLHVPPSSLLPHVTTKDIQERLADGQHVFHLNKYAVYCRYTAKSDLATPAQFARIIACRTDFLKAEMLRRVKEVEVPVFKATSKVRSSSPTIMRVSHASKDPNLPAFRITRNPTEAAGLLVQEELSEGIFEEINNVLDANKLLAKNRPDFVLGQEIYYRVYAERHHVEASPTTCNLLARAAAVRFYAPALHWFLRLGPGEVVRLMREVLCKEKSTQNRLVCRLAILIGPKVTSWLKNHFDRQWAKHPQPAQHYFSFKRMLARCGKTDPRLVALELRETSVIEISTESKNIPAAELLKSSQQSGSFLSKACLAVFNGDKEQCGTCRLLDIMTYGADFPKMDEDVHSALLKRTEDSPVGTDRSPGPRPL
jgi:hypothetical protein